jgi:tRNA(adenine34) deaminase
MAYEKKYMLIAYQLAHLCALEGEVPVGAVIVKNGQVIGVGRNRREKKKNALCHAEIEAIDQACRAVGSWRLSGCDLYVTLEPCLMCGGAAINARIRQVYFGAYDPKEGACGSVINILTRGFNHRPAFEGGHEEELCQKQLADFFEALRMMKEYKMIVRRLTNMDYEGAFPLFAGTSREIGVYEEIVAEGAKAFYKFLSKGYSMVAICDDKVVAMGTVDISGEIKTLGVSLNMRGKKLGQKLLYSLEKKARNAEKPFVWVQKNSQSIDFFKRCGYSEQENILIKYFYRDDMLENQQNGGGFGAKEKK